MAKTDTSTKNLKTVGTKKAPAKKAPVKTEDSSVVTSGGLGRRREITGVVVSDKMQKTIVVKTDRSVRHHFYKKYFVKSSKYKAHDETNEAKVGDLVMLVESRPLSREKRWVLKKILRKAAAVMTVEV